MHADLSDPEPSSLTKGIRVSEALVPQLRSSSAEGAGGSLAIQRRFARMCRKLREQVQAATGIGLARATSGRLRPQRLRLSALTAMPPLSYLATGDPGGRPIVFVHGTPGEATDWAPFLINASGKQRRIALDRPGFGKSGPGTPVVRLSDQARAVAVLVNSGAEPAVVVGSSYGGAVALRLAADLPEAVAGVLLVGSAADPANESIHPVQRLAASRAFARVLPRALAHANAELLALRAELEALEDRLGRIRAPVTIMQGLRDTLVSPGNVTYLLERLSNSVRTRTVLIEHAGHFLHILEPQLVEAALEQVLADAGSP